MPGGSEEESDSDLTGAEEDEATTGTGEQDESSEDSESSESSESSDTDDSTGTDDSTEGGACEPDCGEHGSCDLDSGMCICETGFAGPACDDYFESCADILVAFPDAPDGVYTLAPEGSDPFEGWCDQTRLGGGWLVVFKNHGGAQGGGEVSNLDLLEGTPVGFSGPISSHIEDFVSGVNSEAWAHYKGRSQQEWMKLGTLWDPNGIEVAEHQIVAQFGEVSFGWLIDALALDPGCHDAPGAISVTLDGRHYLGQTNVIYNTEWMGKIGVGLAAEGDYGCQQPLSNVVSDTDDLLVRIDGHDSNQTLGLLFSYSHEESGRDSSRCQFACWSDSDPGYYDAFTWMVR